jgi:intracellular septation protein A
MNNLLKGSQWQVNDKNIKIILWTQITLKWLFWKSKHVFVYEFFIFLGLKSIYIYIYGTKLRRQKITE